MPDCWSQQPPFPRYLTDRLSEQKHTSFYISAEGHKALRLEAIKRGLSMSQLIARALADAGVDIPAEDLKK